MKTIKLSRGKSALVDDDVYKEINSVSWCWIPRGASMGYAARSAKVKGKYITWYMAWSVKGRPKKGSVVDHINGDSLDNRLENLRFATMSQNTKNRKMSKNNTSGFKGVVWNKRDKKYQAVIIVNRKRRSLGYYLDPLEAHAAYIKASRQYFGDFHRDI